MKILSIDIGIKNFAYCVLESDDTGICKLEDWSVVELCDSKTNASKVDLIIVGSVMNEKFNKIFKKYNFDKIVIENQIGRNAIRMKMVQGMVSMYFIINKYSIDKIINYNAVHKLKNFMKSKTKTTYQERKKLSKEVCKKLVEEEFHYMNKVFNKSKKKDDLADCLLQGLDYLKKNSNLDDSYFNVMEK